MCKKCDELWQKLGSEAKSSEGVWASDLSNEIAQVVAARSAELAFKLVMELQNELNPADVHHLYMQIRSAIIDAIAGVPVCLSALIPDMNPLEIVDRSTRTTIRVMKMMGHNVNFEGVVVNNAGKTEVHRVGEKPPGGRDLDDVIAEAVGDVSSDDKDLN
jgi:hypothetical protein